METERKVSELDAQARSLLERVFGQDLANEPNAIVVLKNVHAPSDSANLPGDIPSWCDVLDGLSEEDLDDVNAMLQVPVRLSR